MWIEILLGTAIEDYRKYALWRIVAPYLVNIRKLSHQDAVSVIREWLDKCDKLKLTHSERFVIETVTESYHNIYDCTRSYSRDFDYGYTG